MVGAVLGAVGSGVGAYLGYKAAGKGAEAGKKAAKKQKLLAQKERADAQAQYVSDTGTLNKVLPEQQAARARGYADSNRLLQAGMAGNAEALQPYMDAGQRALDAQRGQFGGPDAQGYIDRFHESPDYLLNYDAAIKAGQEGVDARYTAGGGLNSGAALKALQDRGVETTNKFVNQYADRIGQGIATGMDASGRYVDAQGRLVGLGMESAGQFGTGNAADLGAYATNTLNLGENRLGHLYTGYGNEAQAAANKAAAIAGGATGQAGAINSGIQNAFSAINNAGPWSSGGGTSNPYAASYGSNPYGGQMPINRLNAAGGRIMASGI